MPKTKTEKKGTRKPTKKTKDKKVDVGKKGAEEPRPRRFQDVKADAEADRKKAGNSEEPTKGYGGFRKRTCEWWLKFVKSTSDAEDAHMAEQILAESQDIIDTLGGGDEEDEEKEREVDDAAGGPPVRIPQNLEKALLGVPIEATPYAIYFYLYHKCFEENKGKSTAWQIFSAWKKYYDDLDGDNYQGKWHQDRNTKEWSGNPTQCAMVLDMLKACQNKDGETERKHSRAISIEDMKALYDWSLRECPEDLKVKDVETLAKITEHLHFRAFITLAFNLWTRNSEACNLQWKHVEIDAEARPGSTPGDGNPINVYLLERKGWQKKMAKGETQLNGHLYRLYPQAEPSIDAYNHLLAWKIHLETHILKRPVQPDDYLFPSVGMGGHSIQIGTQISADTIQKKVNEFAAAAGLQGAGKFTTHCFRRGGAQFRFMFAPIGERWTLARVRWWGGWAPNERRDTMIRYLLDELYTYEEDHSDALCPINLAKNQSHLGEAAAVKPLATYEARRMIKEMESRLSTKIEALHVAYPQHHFSQAGTSFLYPYPATSIPYYHIPILPANPGVSSSNPARPGLSPYPFHPTQPQPSPFIHPNPTNQLTPGPVNSSPKTPQLPTVSSSPSGIQSYAPITPSRSTPLPAAPHLLCIPSIPKGVAQDQAWEQVIRDWDEADSSRGLVHALKDWDEGWYKHPSKAVLYSQRRKIALEFIDTFGRDKKGFCEAYPDYQRGIRALHRAILLRQQAEGRAKVRRSHKSQQDGAEDEEMSGSD